MKPKTSAINIIFIFLILGSILIALFTPAVPGSEKSRMAEITAASFDAAKSAVSLAISLIGAMALWLGLVKIAEDAGLLTTLARALKPVMIRLFPGVPEEHPGMSMMILNLASNIMGLGNAATPFGIRAMQELDKLNPKKGEATNAMCLFLAINTSSITLLPLGVIAVRAAAGALKPASIIIPSILATSFSTIVAIIAAKLFERRFTENYDFAEQSRNDISNQNDTALPKLQEPVKPESWRKLLLPGFCAVFALAFIYQLSLTIFNHYDVSKFLNEVSTNWLIPFLMGILIIYGISRKIDVYASVCNGAKEGFQVAVKIIPFLVAILVAIGMFRASGAMELITGIINPFMNLIGMPPETLPLALVRPLSGSGAFALMSDIVAKNPNSLPAFIASIMQGSTETTFYVLAVYFGSVGVFKVRHAVAVGLLADVAGILSSVVLGRLFYYL
ncbi:MAG: spore maturation protein [Candidatus Schekmanbacteria bacterium RBG_13_48_7]|uniref:Spore maturation protein n=1 Tax=Candidatus Schekmanbacteria bacterium RBG_13_48_7 TaxID=1817878 RepID=A0A1F7RR55_9BACT|nr:MAG: spore maturation protein [Candidatus Schekmanbacteria bacterium RBG_13_48_7]